ncbi:zinc finger and SCAN domain-containing protein 1 [Elephas maximus indicus]|uniref:zinc finger and SCAN domain-containing protein 1 n=1 Tax=Elephas maximus indicus TaxID=99487 RepID=UPI002116C45B|nr:zinc finger and SCAN domain-containing protein 1 [Elephas maximus indicus]
MLPLARGFASCRSTQTPAPSEKDGAVRPASPGDAEAWRLCFRQFKYCTVTGLQQALRQLWTLCHLWLWPDTCSKEQILELLVLEQFLSSLTCKMRSWVQSQGPQTCREATSLVEDLMQMFQQECKKPQARWSPGTVVVSLDSDGHQDRGTGEEEDRNSMRLPRAQSQRDPAQASELAQEVAAMGLHQGDQWLELTQWSLHTKLPLSTFLRSPVSGTRLDCWRVEDRLLRNGHSLPRRAQDSAQPSHQPIFAAPKSPALPGPVLAGPLRPNPLLLAPPSLVTGPQRSSPLKREGQPLQGPLRRPRPQGALEPRGRPRSGQPLECAECGEVSPWVTHFIEHQKGHNREVPFPCPECRKGFLHASVLAEHRKIHRLEPPRKKAHPGEGRRAKARKSPGKASGQPGNRCADPSHYGMRSPASHSPERPFEGSVCGKTFPWMAHLINHQKLHAAP